MVDERCGFIDAGAGPGEVVDGVIDEAADGLVFVIVRPWMVSASPVHEVQLRGMASTSTIISRTISAGVRSIMVRPYRVDQRSSPERTVAELVDLGEERGDGWSRVEVRPDVELEVASLPVERPLFGGVAPSAPGDRVSRRQLVLPSAPVGP